MGLKSTSICAMKQILCGPPVRLGPGLSRCKLRSCRKASCYRTTLAGKCLILLHTNLPALVAHVTVCFILGQQPLNMTKVPREVQQPPGYRLLTGLNANTACCPFIGFTVAARQPSATHCCCQSIPSPPPSSDLDASLLCDRASAACLPTSSSSTYSDMCSGKALPCWGSARHKHIV